MDSIQQIENQWLADASPRKEKIMVKATATEKAHLQKLAREHKMSMSAFIRMQCLYRPVIVKRTKGKK